MVNIVPSTGRIWGLFFRSARSLSKTAPKSSFSPVSEVSKIKDLTPCILLIAALIFPVCAWADLSDLKVYSPIIEKGERQFEIIGNVTMDGEEELDGFQHHEFELEYGVTDFWATSITASLIKPATEALKYDILGWENTLQLTGEGRYWLDLGLHLEVELNDEGDESHNLEGRFLFRKVAGEFEHILNLNFEQAFGNGADESTELEYIWRTRMNLSEHTSIGFEAFGTIGEIKEVPALSEQDHRLGPSIYHTLDLGGVEIEFNLIWLLGLTESSPDHIPHWQIEIDF